MIEDTVLPTADSHSAGLNVGHDQDAITPLSAATDTTGIDGPQAPESASTSRPQAPLIGTTDDETSKRLSAGTIAAENQGAETSFDPINRTSSSSDTKARTDSGEWNGDLTDASTAPEPDIEALQCFDDADSENGETITGDKKSHKSSSDRQQRSCPIRYCGCSSRFFRCVLRRAVIFLVISTLLLLVICAIGARIERGYIQKRMSTAHLYATNDVCAMDGSDQVTTFPSTQEAHDNGNQVAHCGQCGQCSTRQDMEIMGQTKATLTRDSTRCAFLMFLGNPKLVSKCMKEKVGFTDSCTGCWTNNIQCTFQKCKFTCLQSKMLGESNNGGADGSLNSCLECDEKMCGPDFLTCSGANRRRMGVVSDIGRDAQQEQCGTVDFSWGSM